MPTAPDSARDEGDRGSKLILARHSLASKDAASPASEWRLSDEGRRRCSRLAGALAPYGVSRVVSSVEAKAIETAGLVAALLGAPAESAEGLHEHERRGVGLLPAAEFRARLQRLFLEPGHLVLGDETAEACRARVSGAVDRVMAQYPGECVCIVGHGTVLALLAAGTGVDGYALWQRLGMPAFVVLSYPSLRIERVWEGVGDEGACR